MEAFLANISSFPTAIFTTLNIVVCGYWLLLIIGVLDLDFLDFDIDVDVDAEGGEMSFIASVLSFFGLTRVPFAVVLTILSLFGFILSYYAVHFGFLLDSQIWLKYLSGSAIFIISFILALPLSGFAIKPLNKFFIRLDSQAENKSLLGVTCTIRSSRVDKDFGEAHCTVDGASLIVKVRCADEQFKRGDKAVIIEHDPEQNIYHVVSTIKFNQ